MTAPTTVSEHRDALQVEGLCIGADRPVPLPHLSSLLAAIAVRLKLCKPICVVLLSTENLAELTAVLVAMHSLAADAAELTKQASDRIFVPGNRIRTLVGGYVLHVVRKVKITRERGPANRPWSADECRVVLEHAPPQLAVPIALAMYGGLRKADVLSATMAAISGGEITVRTSKRGKQISVPVHPMLKAAIES